MRYGYLDQIISSYWPSYEICMGESQRRLATRRTALWVNIKICFSLHALSCCSGQLEWANEKREEIRWLLMSINNRPGVSSEGLRLIKLLLVNTVNFRNQRPRHHNCRLYNNHVKVTANHVKFARFVLLPVSEAKTWLPFFFLCSL